MMLLLFVMLLFFSIVIFYLCLQFYREQKRFQKKMEMLEKIIAEGNEQTVIQTNKLLLSEELDKTLKTNKARLSDAIFNLNYDVFELLSQNNLLKPRK